MPDPDAAGYPSHPSMNDGGEPAGDGPAIAPRYGSPVPPAYTPPAQRSPGPEDRPGYGQAGQPGYPAPGPTGYPAPGQPGYPPPGQPGYPPAGHVQAGQAGGYPPPGQGGYPPQYGYPGQPGPPAFGVPQQRYPVGFTPPPQPWPPRPPRRGMSPMKLVLLISLPVLLVAGLCSGALIWSANKKPGTSSLPGYPGDRDSRNTKVPSYVDERKAAEDAASTAIGGALTAQSGGLLAGDKGKFTGVADPSQKRVGTYLADRFASLRALGIAKWDARVIDVNGSGNRWDATIKVGYCFAKGCARTLVVQFETDWDLRDKARPRMTSIRERTPGQESPPWTKSVLKAKIGSRVVVAASGSGASKLSSMLSRAEAAARVADKFATSAKPGRYIVYFASSREWREWPYQPLGDWVGGYAYETSESLVINPKVASSYVPILLKHELTHVSSLAGRSRQVRDYDAWWLNEGLAEYAAEGSSFSGYTARRETTSFVNCCYRDLRVGRPTNSASASSASGRYGAAYLGISCLMKKYGKARTLSLFKAVAVEAQPLTSAVTAKLGTSWTSLNKMCNSYIRGIA